MTKKLTNSPESESAISETQDSDTPSKSIVHSDIPDLREQHEEWCGKPMSNKHVQFECICMLDCSGMTKEQVDNILEWQRNHDSALLDKVEGLIGEDEKVFGGYQATRNEVRQQFRAEIAKLRKGE